MNTSRRVNTRRDFIKQSAITAALYPFFHACSQGSNSSAAPPDKAAIGKFRKGFRGQIIMPGDPGYEARRRSRVVNPATDFRPAMIASCRDEQDILRSIDFARQHQLEIAVRSGNHSNMSWGTCDKGMVIDLSLLKSVSVDADRGIAHAGAGANAEEILAATAPYGLAPVLGQCGTVGSGVTLGGGLGWLSGKYGAACDNLVAADLVTAEAGIVKADNNTNADLFWAIRGGGGNFGVATALTYKLHPVGEVLGGSLLYSIADARAVSQLFIEVMTQAPDELQADLYFIDDHCGVDVVYAGQTQQGERLVEGFRQIRKPLKDSVRRRPFAEIYRMNSDTASVSFNFNSDKGTYIQQLSMEAVDLVLDSMAQAPRGAGVFFNFSHYMHGEVCRIRPDATAFELRKQGAAHLVIGISWQRAEEAASCLKWDTENFERLQPLSGRRIYANFMSVPGGKTAESVFGGNFTRLKQIKQDVDPHNIFHLNQNILPG